MAADFDVKVALFEVGDMSESQIVRPKLAEKIRVLLNKVRTEDRQSIFKVYGGQPE